MQIFFVMVITNSTFEISRTIQMRLKRSARVKTSDLKKTEWLRTETRDLNTKHKAIKIVGSKGNLTHTCVLCV